MRVRWDTVFAIVIAELRMLVRDGRTIVTAIVLPLLILPLILFSVSLTEKKREQRISTTTYRYAVTGSDLEFAQDFAGKALAVANFKPLKLERVESTNAQQTLAQAQIHFILETDNVGEVGDQARGSSSDTPKIRIIFRADREDSAAGAQKIHQHLELARSLEREKLLRDAGFPLTFRDVAKVETVNLASEGSVAGLTLGRILPLLILMFLFTGGAVVATDLIAGEKERGTLETLLTSAARLPEITAAKLLVIFAVGLVICSIQCLNLMVYVGFALIHVPANFAAAVPWPVAGLLLFLFLPVAALVAGLLLVVSGYARSYKEAQLYFQPIFLVGLLLGLAPLLPAVPLRSPIVIVPIANLSVAVKDVLIGSFDWPMLAVSWVVTAAAAGWTIRTTAKVLSQERFITTTDTEPLEKRRGLELFERHVLGWFAVLWALLILINNYISGWDIRAQILVNLVGLFFTATFLLLRRYRLSLKDAWALRPPKAMVWPIILVLTPCGTLTGIGLFRLVDRVLPMPPEIIRAFSEAILPANIPFLQIFIFLALMPGIFEELTFRGLLLHGLHRRLHPAAVVMVVGLIFGLFHVALFRVLPTAWLGMLFAMVTLLTGSIFPAMLGHALNNGLGLLAARQGLPIEELEPQYYWAGTVGLLFSLWLLWRNRTPYPGLRPWKRSAGGPNFPST